MSTVSRRAVLHSATGAAAAFAAGALRPGSILNAAPDAAGPKFKLGLVTYQVAADWDVPTILRVCKSVGIGGVELRTTHKHGVEPALSKDQRAEVRKQFAGAGTDIWGLGTVCEFQSSDPAVVEKNIEICKQFTDLAHDLGARGVKVRPNGLPAGVPVEKALAQIGTALKACGDAAKSSGVEIWVEVHGKGTQDPPNARTIMEACGHESVGLTWNSNDGEAKNGSVAESFAMLKPWIKSVHINDLEKDAKGVYPYRELFKLLNESGYERYTLCEYGKKPESVEAGEAFLKQYKALWTKLATA